LRKKTAQEQGKKKNIMIRKTPLKAIRAKLCPATDCDLYPYRMGKKPGIKSNNPRGNPEALRKYQESQKALS